MFKNIILFSHNKGQLLKGVEQTPYILSKYFQEDNTLFHVNNYNNLYQNLYRLNHFNRIIKGKRLNIGGDHSMSIATVADSLNRYPNLKLIWMDAHCDINTYEKSNSKNFHGMPLSILSGIDELKHKFKFHNNYLNLNNLLYIGIRDIDPFEYEILNKYNIQYITVNHFETQMEKSLKIIQNFIMDNPIHLSFDVDVIDPKYMPCTGTPVFNGLSLKSCKSILNQLFMNNIVSMDLTELNLDIGTSYQRKKSLNNILNLFHPYIFT